MKQNPVRIFISYTESDLNWALYIADFFHGVGHKTVMQGLDSPGAEENFVLWINRQLELADIVLPVYSKGYFKSEWCTREWTAALGRRKIIPVRVSACDIPLILEKINFVDFVGKSEKVCRDGLLRMVNPSLRERVLLPDFDRMNPSRQADIMKMRWSAVKRRLQVIGLLGAAVVFAPGPDGGISPETATGGGLEGVPEDTFPSSSPDVDPGSTLWQ